MEGSIAIEEENINLIKQEVKLHSGNLEDLSERQQSIYNQKLFPKHEQISSYTLQHEIKTKHRNPEDRKANIPRRMRLNEEQIRNIKQNYGRNSEKWSSFNDLVHTSPRKFPFETNRLSNSINGSQTKETEQKKYEEKYNQLMTKYIQLQKNHKNVQGLYKEEKMKRLRLEEDISKLLQEVSKYRLTLK